MVKHFPPFLCCIAYRSHVYLNMGSTNPMLNPYDQPGTGVKQLISLLERRIQYLQTALESLKKAEGLDGEADRHIEVATPSKPRKTSRSRSEAMKAAWARRRAAERQARSTE